MAAGSIRHGAAAIALLAALASAPGAANASLITDGDFDSLPTGLAPPGGTITVNDWVFGHYGGVEIFGGNRMVRLESEGLPTIDPTASQTVSGLTIGASYELAWDMALRFNVSGAGNGPSFGVFLDNQTFSSALYLDTYLSTTFVTQAVTFVATSTTHTFIFAGELDGRSNGGGTTDVSYRLDNVSLNAVAVSAPSMAGLFGLAGLLLAKRRRR